jgi:hypothetical protein
LTISRIRLPRREGLLQKAHEQGNLIEGLILYASLIDALLRNLVAIEAGHKAPAIKGDIKFAGVTLNNAFFEHDESNWFNERQIYDTALKHSVVNDAEHRHLNEMYSFRNRVVHRFIISDIAYSDLAEPLMEYEKIFWRLYQKLEAIEQPPVSIPGVEKDAVKKRILRKIDRNQQ